MFWKKKESKEIGEKLPGPRDIPELVGRFLVVQKKKDPDWVWRLKGVILPTEKKKAFFCRVFDEGQVTRAGLKIKDWNSLNDHPELIIWEGYFDRETNEVREEKYIKP